MQVRARGMSSANDQEFPKLRVEIDDAEDLSGTSFKGSRNFRINTHVSTNPKSEWTEMGRLNDERSPYREALGFEIANAMGLATPGYRRARIGYEDTGAREKFLKNALLIETDKKFAERFNAKVLSLEDFLATEVSKIPTRLAANFFMFHILIGNDDIGLRIKNESLAATEKYRPMFNTTVFQLPSGEQFPLVYDLDLSDLMAARKNQNEKGFLIEGLELKELRMVRTLVSLAKLRARLSLSEYRQAWEDFVAHEPQIQKAIADSIIDEAGRKNAQERIEVLKQAGRILSQTKMIGKKDVQFFTDANLKTSLIKPMPISEGDGPLLPGTSFKILEQKGAVTKIVMIDHSYILKDFKQSTGYIRTADLVSATVDLPAELQGYDDERSFMYGH